ncbi:MAG: hypothetical protein EKK63_04985 [Acinetobacter sp.]|uniref:hypothetical protein n=1 Tax=Acinetobacter sp. TaxID=472 RepID=UPI000FAB0200|nr:hypothetical protein [Acinetobacter sp.]RUP41612.1 MAG: hypothetical protein EKK63_04985 [Acinetobacter sp.]
MEKVIIKMKDKNNSHLLLGPVKVSVSGSKVVEVDATDKVLDGLKKGLFVKATEAELKQWNEKNAPVKKEEAPVAPVATTVVGGTKPEDGGLTDEEKLKLDAAKAEADAAKEQVGKLLDSWKEEKKVSFSPGGGWKFGDVVLGKNKVEAIEFLQSNTAVAEEIANKVVAES